MVRTAALAISLLFVVTTQSFAHGTSSLKQQIKNAITKSVKAGVSISDATGNEVIAFNGDMHFPMQSVFKFHIALVVLSEVDKGNLSLDQKINIRKDQLLPGLWAPLRKKYPEGGSIRLDEIIEYTVALSDNVGCDALLRLLGGPSVVENYFSNLGFKDFEVKINEEVMQSNWDLQFLNWTTPKEANRILIRFYENKDGLLSEQSYRFIWDVMKGTKTGKNRIRGHLPEDTVVAHKTGWSGKHKETGISAAVNNIGVVFLPDGNYFYISVFITESSESTKTNEKIIADVSRAAWDYFNTK